jgi:hypothetical protein
VAIPTSSRGPAKSAPSHTSVAKARPIPPSRSLSAGECATGRSGSSNFGTVGSSPPIEGLPQPETGARAGARGGLFGCARRVSIASSAPSTIPEASSIGVFPPSTHTSHALEPSHRTAIGAPSICAPRRRRRALAASSAFAGSVKRPHHRTSTPEAEAGRAASHAARKIQIPRIIRGFTEIGTRRLRFGWTNPESYPIAYFECSDGPTCFVFKIFAMHRSGRPAPATNSKR